VVTGKHALLPNQGKVCHLISRSRDSIQRMPQIGNKCGSTITWVSTGNVLSAVVRSRNGKTGRSMSTVEGATCSLAEEVAHEEREYDVKDWHVFMDQGGELCRSKVIRDLFEKEFDYEMRVTGTGAHHQNGLVERANQTMDNAIRAMLIGAGLPVKFWPYAFRHFLRIKNLALPRRDSAESAHQKPHGEKDNLGLLRTL